MDIISMQIANKVLKRMNTEFNGLYDMFISTGGQKTFTTTKPHDIENHGLHVYVNGYHAVENEDYTHTDSKNFEFKNGLSKGDIILATTQIMGIPKFEVINPAYDDSTIKGELTSINNRIATILNALDEDADGSILDTIADIKKQWSDADGNLMRLIEQKATQEELAALKKEVEDLKTNMPDVFDPTYLEQKVEKVEQDVSTISAKVQAIEVTMNSKDLFLYDESTGRKHKLSLLNGSISARIAGDPLLLTHTAPLESIVNEQKEFKLNILSNMDMGQKVKIIVSHNDKIQIEQNDGQSWKIFKTTSIESLTNLVYNLRLTGNEVGIHEVNISVLKFDNNTELASIAFSVNTKESPHSIISGAVTLNGADNEKVLVQLQLSGDENVIAVGVPSDGTFSHKVFEAGEYTLSIINSATTHDVDGISSIQVAVELDTNYTGHVFTLKAISSEPIVGGVTDIVFVESKEVVIK